MSAITELLTEAMDKVDELEQELAVAPSTEIWAVIIAIVESASDEAAWSDPSVGHVVVEIGKDQLAILAESVGADITPTGRTLVVAAPSDPQEQP